MVSRFLGAALAVTLLFAACGDEPADREVSPAPPAASASSPSVPREVRTIDARVTIETTGDVDVRFDQVTKLTVSHLDPQDKDLSLLTIGIGDFKDVGDGRKFRAAFDLAGAYRGAGAYSIPPAGNAGASLSNTFVDLIALKDPSGAVTPANLASLARFEHPKRPCRVEIGTDEATGSVRCDALHTADGRTVAFAMTWEAVA